MKTNEPKIFSYYNDRTFFGETFYNLSNKQCKQNQIFAHMTFFLTHREPSFAGKCTYVFLLQISFLGYQSTATWGKLQFAATANDNDVPTQIRQHIRHMKAC